MGVAVFEAYSLMIRHLVGKKIPYAPIPELASFASADLNGIFYGIIVLRTLVRFKDFDTSMVANAVKYWG